MKRIGIGSIQRRDKPDQVITSRAIRRDVQHRANPVQFARQLHVDPTGKPHQWVQTAPIRSIVSSMPNALSRLSPNRASQSS